MQVAAILFAMAAAGGLLMLVMCLRGADRPPTWLALGHGALAVAGLITLILAAVNDGLPQLAQIALGVFVLAALGGSFLFFGYHLKNRPLPKPIIIGHGLIAATGLALLLTEVFRR